MDVCKANELLILNGRKIGDIFGKMTSHQWNGSSVVDYFLAQNSFCQNISQFSVGNYIPWLSDHCPIYATILTNEAMVKRCEESSLRDAQPGFIWDGNARDRYLAGLKSKENMEKLSKLSNSSNLNPTDFSKEIRDILIGNAHLCKIKQKKIRKDTAQQSFPWFDKECRELKNKLRVNSKRLSKNHKNKNDRISTFQSKKDLKKLVRKKSMVINGMSYPI